jgi:MFS family permease
MQPPATSCPGGPPDLPEAARLGSLRWIVAQNALNAAFAFLTIFGSVFLLFLSELGLPKAQIGLLLSLLPFSGLLALWSAPWVTRLGRRRVFLVCWTARKFVAAGLLLLPWVLLRYGHNTALVFLIGIVAVFAVLRSLAETAWYPWIQEVVPDRVRGRFGAISTVVSTVASVAALAIAGQVIREGDGLDRFLLLIGGGVVVGLLGTAAMIPVPGGEPQPTVGSGDGHLANMRHALADRNFVLYLAGLGGVTVGTLLYLTFLPLFLRERLGLAPGVVVTLDTAVMIGGGLSALVWGWAADRVGSRPVLMSSVALTLLIPVGWLLLPREAPHLVVWCALLYFSHGVAFTGAAIGAGRLLFNAVIPVCDNTAYTALYYAWSGLVGGVAPLLAGGLLQAYGPWQRQVGWLTADGNAVLFVLAIALIVVGGACFHRVRPDGRYSTRGVLHIVTSRFLRRLSWR